MYTHKEGLCFFQVAIKIELQVEYNYVASASILVLLLVKELNETRTRSCGGSRGLGI